MAKFCPNCGTEKGPFYRGFCRDCFIAKHKLAEIPEKIELEKCNKCLKVMVSGRLAELNDSVLEKMIEKKTRIFELESPKFEFKFSDSDSGISAEIKIFGTLDSRPVFFEGKTQIVFKAMQCDNCMKQVSYYHEAIIQLRSEDKKKLENALEKTKELVHSSGKKFPLAVIIDIKKSKNGYDLLVGSSKSAVMAARQIAKKFDSKIIVSSKLIGLDKKQKQKKRFTFCLRF